MKPTDFRVLTFDCYGTLIDWESGIHADFQPLLALIGRGLGVMPRWRCLRTTRRHLLKPAGLYPTRPATEGNKPAKLKAIAAALKHCDQVTRCCMDQRTGYSGLSPIRFHAMRTEVGCPNSSMRCGFRRKAARDSDLIPALLPI